MHFADGVSYFAKGSIVLRLEAFNFLSFIKLFVLLYNSYCSLGLEKSLGTDLRDAQMKTG